MLTFGDTDKVFELQGNLLEMITDENYNVDLAYLLHQKILYDFAGEMYFDDRALRNNVVREKSPKRIFISSGIMVSASGVSSSHKQQSFSKTRFLSSDFLCYRLKLSLQKKQAANNCDKINEEIIAVVDKFLEYKCITTKQHKCLLLECLN